MSLLEVEGLEAGYGPVTVVRDLSFTVEEGKVVTILGANGAGKTTTLRALSGVARRARARRRSTARQLVGRTPEWIVRRGIAHVPEGRGNFASLTVEENLAPRRLRPQGRRQGARGHPALLRVLPAAGGAQHAGGRLALAAASSRCSRSRAG